MKKLIVFDAMGVVYKEGDDVGRLLLPYLKKYIPELALDYLHKLYLNLSLGKITSEDFFCELGLCDMFPEIQYEYLDACIEMDAQFLSVANSLSDRYDFAMLSNDVSEWSQYLREKFGLDELFTDAIISGDVGCRKPSSEIFEILLRRTHRSPCDICFIDDKLDNISAARSLGINTILFDRNLQNTKNGGITISDFSRLKETIAKIFP